jgi:hypothetical protein
VACHKVGRPTTYLIRIAIALDLNRFKADGVFRFLQLLISNGWVDLVRGSRDPISIKIRRFPFAVIHLHMRRTPTPPPPPPPPEYML